MARPSVTAAPLRVALLGIGTVGREVARGLVGRPDELAAAAGGRRLELVAIGVRDPGRSRGVDLPGRVERTADLAALATAPDVDVVVELLGGLEPAGALVARALESGKQVVTANKALLARRGAELEACAREVGAALRFEAAVAGGVPILSPLASDLAANRWSALRGIVNGTTNYLLTLMAEEGRGYDEVLVDAQARGYAEADPSADVEARDPADKLAILCRLCFGGWPDVDAIPRTGITAVSAGAIGAARERGLTVKLLARAERRGERLLASVAPTCLPASSALGRTNGVTNRIEVTGEPVGTVAFEGPGAGGAATSSAVLGDLVALARGAGSTWAGQPVAVELRLADPAEGAVDEHPIDLDGTPYPLVEA
jgi:homoserine dehydrogenase